MNQIFLLILLLPLYTQAGNGQCGGTSVNVYDPSKDGGAKNGAQVVSPDRRSTQMQGRSRSVSVNVRAGQQEQSQDLSRASFSSRLDSQAGKGSPKSKSKNNPTGEERKEEECIEQPVPQPGKKAPVVAAKRVIAAAKSHCASARINSRGKPAASDNNKDSGRASEPVGKRAKERLAQKLPAFQVAQISNNANPSQPQSAPTIPMDG